MTILAEAIDRLAEVAGQQADELRRVRVDRERARWDEPEAVAWRRAVRAPLRRPAWGMVAAATVPGMVEQFDAVVPAEFVARVDIDVFEIACPCKATPRVATGQVGECECGRFFLTDGRTIRVARYELDAPAADEEAAQANVD